MTTIAWSRVVSQGLHDQDCVTRITWSGLHEQDCMTKIAWPGMYEQDCMSKITCPGLRDQFCMIKSCIKRIAWPELHDQNCMMFSPGPIACPVNTKKVLVLHANNNTPPSALQQMSLNYSVHYRNVRIGSWDLHVHNTAIFVWFMLNICLPKHPIYWYIP